MRWLAVAVLLFATSASALPTLLPMRLVNIPGPSGGSCTDGVDCYCDTVSDPDLILCEDFEHADYYENTSNDWAAQSSYRGDTSRWTLNYGAGGYYGAWHNGQPASPQIGSTCVDSQCASAEYCSDAQALVVLGSAGSDCWDGNSIAGLDIQRDDDFNDELGDLTLTGGNSGGGDVFDGNQHLAFRNPAGQLVDIRGSVFFTPVTSIGLTVAMAYSTNLADVSLADDPWKHEEFGDYPLSEFWWAGNTGIAEGFSSTFPFNPFMFGDLGGGYSESACDSALALADQNVGLFNCNSAGLEYGAVNGTGAGQYDQATDWPLGEWGCVRAHINGMGSTDMEIKIWFNEELIIHLDNFDAVAADLHNTDYDEFYWNNYPNANQDPGCTGTCEDVSTETAYRYVDNWHLREGEPVSCASIGF